jgi:hypothetical protein
MSCKAMLRLPVPLEGLTSRTPFWATLLAFAAANLVLFSSLYA